MNKLAFSNKKVAGLSVTIIMLVVGLLIWLMYSGGESSGITIHATADNNETGTRITEERAIELALLHARSWGLEEFTGVRDIGTMKLVEAKEVLIGEYPGKGFTSVLQNIVWVVSLDGRYVKCSPPLANGELDCREKGNMYVILDANNGRIYSWGSKATPLTIPR